MTEVKAGQIITLKDDGYGFVSQIRNKISGKKLYVLSLLNPLGSDPSDCNVKLLVVPKIPRGKYYIWTPRLGIIGLDNVVFHGCFNANDLGSDVISKAKPI